MAGASEAIEDDRVEGCEFSAELPDEIATEDGRAVELTRTSAIKQSHEDSVGCEKEQTCVRATSSGSLPRLWR